MVSPPGAGTASKAARAYGSGVRFLRHPLDAMAEWRGGGLQHHTSGFESRSRLTEGEPGRAGVRLESATDLRVWDSSSPPSASEGELPGWEERLLTVSAFTRWASSAPPSASQRSTSWDCSHILRHARSFARPSAGVEERPSSPSGGTARSRTSRPMGSWVAHVVAQARVDDRP